MSQPAFDFGDEPVDDPANPTYTVAELADALNASLRRGFSDGVWVRGEIQGWSERNQHAYFRLADDTAGVKAVLNVQFFANARMKLRPMLQKHRLRLADGMKVRVFGYLDFYAPAGQLGLKMADLDPRFTLGDLAAQRDEIIRRLVAEGLLDANKRTRPVADPAPRRRRQQRRHRGLARLPRRARAQQLRVPPARVRRPGPGPDGGPWDQPRDRRARGATRPRRDRRHPWRRRAQRARHVRCRADRPSDRRVARSGVHRPRSRGRPQRGGRGGPHRVQDTDGVRGGAGRCGPCLPGVERAILERDQRAVPPPARQRNRAGHRPRPSDRPPHPRRRRAGRRTARDARRRPSAPERHGRSWRRGRASTTSQPASSDARTSSSPPRTVTSPRSRHGSGCSTRSTCWPAAGRSREPTTAVSFAV